MFYNIICVFFVFLLKICSKLYGSEIDSLNIYNDDQIAIEYSSEEIEEEVFQKKGYNMMQSSNFIILNKINAKRISIVLNQFEEKIIDNLVIKFHGCIRKYEYGIYSDYALITLYDIDRDFKTTQFFLGWLVSYPNFITKIEHPIYDMILNSCNVTQ